MTLKDFNKHLSPALTEAMNNLTCDIVSSIELTSIWFPEQYEFFDKYGYQTGYLRLRHGTLSVRCPDINDYEVYAKSNIDDHIGSGEFLSDAIRIRELTCAIKAIISFYDDLHMVYMYQTARFDQMFKLIRGHEQEQLALKDLYLYQSSNFTPNEVIELRKRGPGVTFGEAIKRIREYPNILGAINASMDGGSPTNDDLTLSEQTVTLMCIIFNKDRTEFEEIWKSLRR